MKKCKTCGGSKIIPFPCTDKYRLNHIPCPDCQAGKPEGREKVYIAGIEDKQATIDAQQKYYKECYDELTKCRNSIFNLTEENKKLKAYKSFYDHIRKCVERN